MNINDIMLQGDAGSGTTEASSKYYNVGKNNAAIADAGYLGIRGKAVQTDFMMPQLQGLRESGSENYTGRQATEIAADRVQNDNAASRNLKVVTGEDCAALEDEDSALEEYQKSSLERAVKRIREEREWKEIKNFASSWRTIWKKCSSRDFWRKRARHRSVTRCRKQICLQPKNLWIR